MISNLFLFRKSWSDVDVLFNKTSTNFQSIPGRFEDFLFEEVSGDSK